MGLFQRIRGTGGFSDRRRAQQQAGGLGDFGIDEQGAPTDMRFGAAAVARGSLSEQDIRLSDIPDELKADLIDRQRSLKSRLSATDPIADLEKELGSLGSRETISHKSGRGGFRLGRGGQLEQVGGEAILEDKFEDEQTALKRLLKEDTRTEGRDSAREADIDALSDLADQEINEPGRRTQRNIDALAKAIEDGTIDKEIGLQAIEVLGEPRDKGDQEDFAGMIDKIDPVIRKKLSPDIRASLEAGEVPKELIRKTGSEFKGFKQIDLTDDERKDLISQLSEAQAGRDEKRTELETTVAELRAARESGETPQQLRGRLVGRPRRLQELKEKRVFQTEQKAEQRAFQTEQKTEQRRSSLVESVRRESQKILSNQDNTPEDIKRQMAGLIASLPKDSVQDLKDIFGFSDELINEAKTITGGTPITPKAVKKPKAVITPDVKRAEDILKSAKLVPFDAALEQFKGLKKEGVFNVGMAVEMLNLTDEELGDALLTGHSMLQISGKMTGPMKAIFGPIKSLSKASKLIERMSPLLENLTEAGLERIEIGTLFRALLAESLKGE